MNDTAKRSAFAKLKELFLGEGLLGGISLLARFLYCRIYSLRLKNCGSLLIRGKFSIRGGNFISIGSLQAGSRILIEAVERYHGQQFQPELSIGKRVFFSNDIHIGCTHRVILGDGVMLGSHVYITDHDHGTYGGDEPHSHPDTPPAERPLTTSGTVIIEENVHIGEYVTILKNVRIGRGSIIGAHSNVVHDVPAYSIAVGNPARPIKTFHGDTQLWI